jgi:hydroxymethylglutaryl-CoA lyase
MADSSEVMAALNAPGAIEHRDDITMVGLVLNARGLQGALDNGVDEINVVVVVTDSFAEKNQGTSTAGLIDVWHEVGTAAKSAGLSTSVTLAASFGCPYEGEVSLDRLASVLAGIMETPPDEIALADSIGVASPLDVRARVGVARDVVGDTRLRAHFHNTRNTGIANAAAAVDMGVRVLDASLGGIGGCPFAPDATGNIPTEDLAYMLDRMGFDTGVDLDAACEIVPWLERVLGHPTPGLLAKAGRFPAAS